MLSGLSQSLMLAGWVEESRDVAELAINIAQHVGARAIEGHARNNLGVDLCSLGDFERGMALLREAREIAEDASDDVDDVARAIVNVCAVLNDAGRLDEAARIALEGIEVVASRGLERRKGVWCRCDAAEALLGLGRWEEAEQLVADAFQLDPRGIDLARATWVRGALRLRAGDVEAAADALEQARRLLENTIDDQFVGPFNADLVELSVARGDPDRGLAIAEEAWDLPAQTTAPFAPPLAALATRAAADTALRGARERGGSALEVAVATRWFERCRSRRHRPHRITGGTGLAPDRAGGARTCRRHDRRRGRCLGLGSHRLGAGGPALPAGIHRVAPCRSPAHRRGPGSCAFGPARRPWAQRAPRSPPAARRRRRTGAAGRVDITKDVSGPDRSADPYNLTPRERQILGMLAEGRTNRQIATALFVSHRTVGTHVSNLLVKLDARTRSEAAAIAHRERLL